MYINIYIYVYVYTYLQMYMCVFLCICIHTYIYIYLPESAVVENETALDPRDKLLGLMDSVIFFSISCCSAQCVAVCGSVSQCVAVGSCVL